MSDIIKTLEPDPLLTEKQEAVLTFIGNYFNDKRQYPTNREICEACGIKSTNATPFLSPLIKKGFLLKIPSKRRNIRLTETALPLLETKGLCFDTSTLTGHTPTPGATTAA